MPTKNYPLFFLIALAFMALLIPAPAILSIVMFMMVAWGLWHYKAAWAGLKSEPVWWAVMGVFIMLLPQCLYSDNWHYLGERLRIKLPFLILPFAFAAAKPFGRKQFYLLLAWLSVLMSIVGLGVLINYALHFEAINDSLTYSKSIPTPIHHIRFSLLLALSAIGSGLLASRELAFFYTHQPKSEEELSVKNSIIMLFYWLIHLVFSDAWRKVRIVFAVLCAFQILLLHILAVRSGLFAFYGAMFMLLVQYTIVQRRYLIGVLALALLVTVPLAAYYTIPSVQQKVNLTLWNWQQYKEGIVGEYSDTKRMLSYQVGLDLFQQHPIVGVGMGDAWDTIQATYQSKYNGNTPMLPHNEYLYYAVGTGLIGLLLFLICFFYPLFNRARWREPFTLAFFVISFLSMMTETTIETQVGVAFTILPLCLVLKTKTETEIYSQDKV